MMVTLSINENNYSCEVNPAETLLQTLRKLGFKSVKQGCDTTNCGLCTVWLDESPILSCAMLSSRAEGKQITTLEGVEEEARHFGYFMAQEGADQCGFCSPGFIMSVLAMKRHLVNPSEDDIRDYLRGNLCRCTGYVSQLRAIRRFLEAK